MKNTTLAIKLLLVSCLLVSVAFSSAAHAEMQQLAQSRDWNASFDQSRCIASVTKNQNQTQDHLLVRTDNKSTGKNGVAGLIVLNSVGKRNNLFIAMRDYTVDLKSLDGEIYGVDRSEQYDFLVNLMLERELSVIESDTGKEVQVFSLLGSGAMIVSSLQKCGFAIPKPQPVETQQRRPSKSISSLQGLLQWYVNTASSYSNDPNGQCYARREQCYSSCEGLSRNDYSSVLSLSTSFTRCQSSCADISC